MKHSSERKVIASGFLLALLMMGGLRVVSYRNAIALIDNTVQVEQTEDELNDLVEIGAGVAQADAGYMAYLLYGNESDRLRHIEAKAQIDQHLQQLNQRLLQDEDYRADITILNQLFVERRLLIEQLLAIAVASEQPMAEQAAIVRQISQNRQSIEQVLARIAAQKNASLRQGDAQLLRQSRMHLLIEYLGTVLVFVLLIGLYALLDRQLVQRQRVESERQKLLQAKEMGELKLRFFSMVSHEFRTPLSVILGSAQLLAENPVVANAANTAKNLDRIQTSARSMNQLLSDILMLTRAEAGKLEFHPAAIDVEEFCLNLLEDMSVATNPLRQIDFKSEGTYAKAQVDEKLLQGLLSNLLSNALKYSEPSTPVTLTLQSTPQTVTFEVRDRGIGIAPEELADLYEPFYRGHNIGRTAGAGLGLAVCKKCVELHQGTIAIKSEVGSGTTVVVTLPTSQPNGRNPD